MQKPTPRDNQPLHRPSYPRRTTSHSHRTPTRRPTTIPRRRPSPGQAHNLATSCCGIANTESSTHPEPDTSPCIAACHSPPRIPLPPPSNKHSRQPVTRATPLRPAPCFLLSSNRSQRAPHLHTSGPLQRSPDHHATHHPHDAEPTRREFPDWQIARSRVVRWEGWESWAAIGACSFRAWDVIGVVTEVQMSILPILFTLGNTCQRADRLHIAASQKGS
jgi:hypothetical protein